MTKKPKDVPKDLPDNLTQTDYAKLTEAVINAAEKAQPILQEYFEKHSMQEIGETPLDPFNIRRTYLDYMMHTFSNPHKLVEAQLEFWDSWGKLWQNSVNRFLDGKENKPLFEPIEGDRRFKDDVWHESAVFDFIKQSYLLTSQTIMKSVHDLDDVEEHEKKKLEFFAKQYIDAISPSNFVLTNPKVIQATLDSGGENLVKGLENLLKDLERGGGQLSISTTDYKAFEVGKNIATTKGKVIFENDLMQLIQYEPTTKDVFKRPLLVIPPWINKYYILDLKSENSFLGWLVDQGHTVFVISWVNPDKSHADMGFDDYMRHGPLKALDVIQEITGEKDANLIGYCLGGTLLATMLAWLHTSKKEDKIASASFLTTLVDFDKAGDLKVFIDEQQIAYMEEKMAKKGFLDANSIKNTFSMLRSSDLIWSFVVNNYLLGKEPFPFDLLYWNDDSTNMPAKMHSFYLRKMYKENLLAKINGLKIAGKDIDMTKVKTPSYFLSTREDHIAPWRATYETPKMFSGPVRFTLAASGHIAGVVNSPKANKYCYFTHDKTPEDPEDWLKKAKENNGSWWPDWQKWIDHYSNGKIKARTPGSKKYPPIENAPGRFVKKRS